MNLRIFLCFTFLLLVLSQGDLTFGQELAPDAEPAAEKPIDAQINDLMAGPTKAITTVIFFAVPVAGVQIPLVLVWFVRSRDATRNLTIPERSPTFKR